MIGVYECAYHELIGVVGDLAVRRSALYYADSYRSEVRVYDFRGILMAIVAKV